MDTVDQGPREPNTWPAPVHAFAERLQRLDWITDLLVSGSLATGDYRPGVSDIDLVAISAPAAPPTMVATLAAVHKDIDRASPTHTNLGCVYLDRTRVADDAVTHPTWTHGRLVSRPLSPIARAELARDGTVVFGNAVGELFPPISDDEVRDAARAELAGYWRTAARRPWWWLDPTIADLGLTAMARSRHAIATGQLLTKSAAIEHINGPEWLRTDLRARRDGHRVRSARLATAWIAWRDARNTIAG